MQRRGIERGTAGTCTAKYRFMKAIVLLAVTACVAAPPSVSNDDGDVSGTQSGGKADGDSSTFAFHTNREADTGAIDKLNAYQLVSLCDLTYVGDTSQIPSKLAAMGISAASGHYKAFSDESTETFAFYVEAGGAAFIVFRGTEKNWPNISEDADLFATSEVIGQVHSGFKTATDAVWQEIHGELATRQATTNLPLYVTGHSMGAAVATIATARALLDSDNGTLDVAALYTFASPRVGNGQFSNDFAQTIAGAGTFYARVVNDCDPVTNVPLRVGPDLIPFYEHVSLGSNENDFVDWLPKGQASLTRSIPFNACPLAGLDYNFDEHLTPAYMTALGAVE